jgi:hypothetical protein
MTELEYYSTEMRDGLSGVLTTSDVIIWAL